MIREGGRRGTSAQALLTARSGCGRSNVNRRSRTGECGSAARLARIVAHAPGYARLVALTDEPRNVTVTERLVLSPPAPADLDSLFAIESDPRLWTHYPSLRHTERSQTLALINLWAKRWEEAGFGPWIARLKDDQRVIGAGGCSLLGGAVWNLGYRLAAEVHGRGYATEIAMPTAASLLEHNVASERVASKLGLQCVYRGPDTSNPSAGAIRLVYADRPLSSTELSTILD